jgi:hypothetical protein
MKRTLKSCLFVTLTCLVFALTLSVSVSAKKVTLSKPKITSVKKKSDKAIRIKWKKVKKAKKYEIHSSVNGKKFKKVGTTTKTYFDNKVTVKEGATYTYKIKAINGKVKSKFSNKKKITIPKSNKLTPSADPKDNFNKVVAYIRSNNLIDASGNHYISATIKSGDTLAKFTITLKNDKLYFNATTEASTGSSTSSMVYGIEEITNDSAVVETGFKNTKGVEVKAHATIKPSAYSGSTKLSFTIDSSNASTSPEDICNNTVKLMILGCDTAFGNAIETITLKHIGFKSF